MGLETGQAGISKKILICFILAWFRSRRITNRSPLTYHGPQELGLFLQNNSGKIETFLVNCTKKEQNHQGGSLDTLDLNLRAYLGNPGPG